MRLLGCLILPLLALAVPALAHDERTDVAGRFDYYVLSLSWSPQYCADAPGDRDRRQCGSGRRYAFVLHGLWPQNERGFPQSCAEGGTLPRALVDDMLDVMPSPSLVRHEWATHGTCSGLTADAYFAAARRAFRSATRCAKSTSTRTRSSAIFCATIPPCRPPASPSSAAAAT